ncbi:MAG: RhuM family protein [Verrucomicrobiota bacterium]
MSHGEFILYTSPDGQTELQLRAEDGTVWLTQLEIAELFDRSKKTISEHLQNIFAEGELEADSVVRNFRTTAADGKNYDTAHYNLEAILAVGFRVKSPRGTQFRIWANTQLKEYLVKGFVMNDERLKDPRGWDYFDELLERVRSIRASEKRFYLPSPSRATRHFDRSPKIRDIYATAIDYGSGSQAARLFFKKAQNKMLWAITGQTAAELVEGRSNPASPNMGLTSWKGHAVRKSDVATAKNYLAQDEIAELDRIVVMYLDYAEDQAQRRQAERLAADADDIKAIEAISRTAEEKKDV